MRKKWLFEHYYRGKWEAGPILSPMSLSTALQYLEEATKHRRVPRRPESGWKEDVTNFRIRHMETGEIIPGEIVG